jgi:hypothetical protein
MRDAIIALEARTGDNFLTAAQNHFRRVVAFVDECGGSLQISQGNHTGLVHSLRRESTGAPTLMRRLKAACDPYELLNPFSDVRTR